MVQKKYEFQNLQEQMNGLIFDVQYGTDAIKDITKSTDHINVSVLNLRKKINHKHLFLFRTFLHIWNKQFL